MKFKIVLLLSILLFIGCDDNGTEPTDTAFSNPAPADGATITSLNFVFDWEADDLPAGTRYDFYLGTNTNPPLVSTDLDQSELLTIWQRQAIAAEFLQEIHDAEQVYRDQEDTYIYNGEIVHPGIPDYWEQYLNLVMDSLDVYSYRMQNDADHFTCTATANLDNDDTIDTWKIDENNYLVHTIEDIDNPFEPGGTYYWKVVARSGDNDSLVSDTWHFSVQPSDQVLTLVSPANNATGVTDDFVFQWEFDGLATSLVSFDVYFDTTSDPSRTIRNYDNTICATPWKLQEITQQTLLELHDRQEYYHSVNDTYFGNGVTFSNSNPGNMISEYHIILYPLDIYSYTIVASENVYTCSATANLDYIDAIVDTWSIDETGTITHTVDDEPVAYQSNTTYYWKIVARYGNNQSLTSDVWSFTTE